MPKELDKEPLIEQKRPLISKLSKFTVICAYFLSLAALFCIAGIPCIHWIPPMLITPMPYKIDLNNALVLITTGRAGIPKNFANEPSTLENGQAIEVLDLRDIKRKCR